MHEADRLGMFAELPIILKALQQRRCAITYPDDCQPNLGHVPLLSVRRRENFAEIKPAFRTLPANDEKAANPMIFN